MPLLKKLAPLFILALFASGAYLMMKGMDNAVAMTKPTAKTQTPTK